MDYGHKDEHFFKAIYGNSWCRMEFFYSLFEKIATFGLFAVNG
jgi:hypothetical protein